MADFKKFFSTLLRHEGGFVNDPDDPGGATNKGITMDTFRRNAAKLGVEPTVENLKALTDDQAYLIYKDRYWDRIQGDRIENQDLAEQICDFTVNAGSHGPKTIQRVLGVKEDGVIGPITLREINQGDAAVLYRNFREERIQYYRQIAVANPRLKKFLKGWEKRANSFDKY